jgi:hypothetical protein
MAKTEVQKRAEVMKKEWWKSRATESSINDLVGMGLLHNKALRGWRALDLESFPDPQPGEIVVFEDFFKRGFGFLFILSSKGCVPTQFFSFPPPFTSTKLLVGLLRISIFLLSILSAEEGVKGGISDHR